MAPGTGACRCSPQWIAALRPRGARRPAEGAAPAGKLRGPKKARREHELQRPRSEMAALASEIAQERQSRAVHSFLSLASPTVASRVEHRSQWVRIAPMTIDFIAWVAGG